MNFLLFISGSSSPTTDRTVCVCVDLLFLVAIIIRCWLNRVLTRQLNPLTIAFLLVSVRMEYLSSCCCCSHRWQRRLQWRWEVNGLLFLLFLVLLEATPATIGSDQQRCYNGPAPVIVNPDADVYLGNERYTPVSASFLFSVGYTPSTLYTFLRKIKV